MKKRLHILILFTCLTSILFSQSLSKRWVEIKRTSEKTVLIDTSSIKSINGKISVWSLIIYNKPISFNNSDQQVSRLKAQYLFDQGREKYSTIGQLYYDSRGRIVGENSSMRLGAGRDNFALNIPVGSDIEDISRAAASINSGSFKLLSFENIQEENSEGIKETPFNDNILPEFNFSAIDTVETQSVELKDEESINENSNDGIDKSSIRKILALSENSARILDPLSGKYTDFKDEVSDTNQKVFVEKEQLKEEKPPEKKSYNPKNERNVTNTIFTDGNFFVIQVSSWKNKNTAQNEMKKFKNKGYDSFIVEARPSHKSGVWFRVRVGYFSTLEEAKSVQKKLN
ncbi:MAG: SPOR domain-containing protein [Bacteroidetes bacterium]|nr:SPOR domain-containing protein [Bacteroidota bacterium]